MTFPSTSQELPLGDGKGGTASVGPQEYVSLQEGGLADPDQDIYADGTNNWVQYLLPGSKLKILVIGVGIHGISSAYHLVHEAGIQTEDLLIIDRAGGWGGTWYWNRSRAHV